MYDLQRHDDCDAVNRVIDEHIDRYDLITSGHESMRESFFPNEPDALKRFVYFIGYGYKIR